MKATPNPDLYRQAPLRHPCPRPWTPALDAAFLALIPALLAACTPSPKVTVQPPPPPVLPKVQERPDPRLEGASLAPLATPQQVVQAVEVGRPDPFAAVLTPRLVAVPASPQVAVIATGQRQSGAPGAPAGSPQAQPQSPLGAPKGLLFQGVLQSPLGREALVDYSPSEGKGGGTRSGSLRVGDVGTARDDSLLPPGWRVRAIDVDRGVLELQAGTQSVKLQL